jgi:hypothetical protein
MHVGTVGVNVPAAASLGRGDDVPACGIRGRFKKELVDRPVRYGVDLDETIFRPWPARLAASAARLPGLSRTVVRTRHRFLPSTAPRLLPE